MQLSRSSNRAKLTDSLKLKTLGESLWGRNRAELTPHTSSLANGGALTFNEMQDQKTLQLVVSGRVRLGGGA
jgi:hypothetical protein